MDAAGPSRYSFGVTQDQEQLMGIPVRRVPAAAPPPLNRIIWLLTKDSLGRELVYKAWMLDGDNLREIPQAFIDAMNNQPRSRF